MQEKSLASSFNILGYGKKLRVQKIQTTMKNKNNWEIIELTAKHIRNQISLLLKSKLKQWKF